MNKAIHIAPRILRRAHSRIGPLHQVNMAGNPMSEVVDSIKRVTEIIGGISVASEEQASGVKS